jgi:hypothetical protein
MLEFTKLLVPSLLEYTREPYELIFIDIGSLDGTAEYLAGLAAGVRHCRVTVVHAETGLDIPDACLPRGGGLETWCWTGNQWFLHSDSIRRSTSVLEANKNRRPAGTSV